MGLAPSDFVVAAAQDAARRVIDEEGVARLSAEAQQRFAVAPLHPAAAGAALKRAVRKHRKLVEAR